MDIFILKLLVRGGIYFYLCRSSWTSHYCVHLTSGKGSWSLCWPSTCMAALCEPPHDKTNNMTVRPAKTQISLGIRPVWSESSLCAQLVAQDQSFLHADSEDSDRTWRMLIWVFAGRTCHFVGFVMLRLMWFYFFHLFLLMPESCYLGHWQFLENALKVFMPALIQKTNIRFVWFFYRSFAESDRKMEKTRAITPYQVVIHLYLKEPWIGEPRLTSFASQQY